MQSFSTFAYVSLLAVAFALPSILAITRKSPRWMAVTAVNIALGWTVVGWFAALVWVFKPIKPRMPRRRFSLLRPRQKTSSVGRGRSAANDNRFLPILSDVPPDWPRAADTDVYRDWLDRGEGLSEATSVAPASRRPKAADARAA